MKKSILILLISTLLLCMTSALPLSASAEAVTPVMTELFEAKHFRTSEKRYVNYQIYIPDDYTPEQKYPVILFLHGAGECGDDLIAHLNTGIIEAFKNPDSVIYDCIVVAPQCPFNQKWVDVAAWTDCEYSTDEIPESDELRDVLELLASLKDTYSTDTNRYYVTGLSMGGYATWDLIVRHPELFAAAMPLCGGADYRKAEAIKDIPIWTFHGLQDSTVPSSGTEKMVDTLKSLGSQAVTYTTYPSLSHNIWSTVYAREDIFPWLLEQTLTDRYPELSETEPVTESNTSAPAVTSPTVSNDASADDTAPTAGCSSSFGVLPLLPVLFSLPILCRKRKFDV